jgi:hypothetical protein
VALLHGPGGTIGAGAGVQGLAGAGGLLGARFVGFPTDLASGCRPGGCRRAPGGLHSALFFRVNPWERPGARIPVLRVCVRPRSADRCRGRGAGPGGRWGPPGGRRGPFFRVSVAVRPSARRPRGPSRLRRKGMFRFPRISW